MTSGSDQTPLNVTDLVTACESRQAGISWPLPVDMKLDGFLKSARAAAERTSRREIVAAIIGMAEFDGEELSQLIRRYRQATVGDVLKPADAANVVSFVQQGPGPRRHRA